MNRGWHRAHMMPKDAGHEERIAWHAEHAAECGCRPVPASLAPEVRVLKGRLHSRLTATDRIYSTQDLTMRTWEDFERMFRKPGEWSSCQCMWFHRDGPRPREEVEGVSSQERNEKNFRTQRALVRRGRSHGVLVYRDGDPIGWCQYGQREEFPRIDNAAKYRGIPPVAGDGQLWRITCFCVDKRHRKQGVAKAALQAAMETIRKKGGGVIEAYPSTRGQGLALHRGTVSMFKKEGFDEVCSLGASNLVVRKTV